MKCTDCDESIVESERKGVIECKGCKQPLHSECVMYSEEEEPFCEVCLSADHAQFRQTMKAAGAVA